MRLIHTLAALGLWALLFAMTAPPLGHAADDFTVAYQRWKSLESQGQWAAALSEAEKVRSIALKQYGTDHAHTGRVLTELAGLYVDCGRYKQAQEAGRRALGINEKEHGKESAAVATAMLHLGRAEIWLRNFAKGKDYLKRCRQLFEQNNAKHQSLVLVTREQCLLHADAAESVEALELGKESVALAVNLWGEDHVEVALSQLRLGHALRAAGELQQSESTLTGALHSLESKFSSKHPDVALAQYWLSAVYKEMGNAERRTELLAEAAAGWEETLGSNHLLLGFVHNDYGQMADDQGDLAGAERSYKKAIELKKASEAEVALSLMNLAIIYSKRGQHDKSMPLMERALKLSENSAGKDSVRTANVLLNYSTGLAQIGNLDASIQASERSLAIYDSAHGLDHDKSILVRSNLASLYRMAGRAEEADKVLENALRDASIKYGPDHPTTATMANARASQLKSLGRFHEAIAEYRRCNAIVTACYGSQHPDVARALQGEAECHARLSNWEAAMQCAESGFKSRSKFALNVLSSLSEREQLAFLKSESIAVAVNALSLATVRADQASIDRSAEWVLNSKALRWSVLSDRAQRARLAGDSNSDPALRDLARLRERLAALVMQAPKPEELKRRVSEVEKLTHQIDEISVTVSSDASAREKQQWITLDEVRVLIPKDSVLVEQACQRLTDFTAPAPKARHLSYGAWIIPAADQGAVQFVHLGSASEVDRAVNHARFAIAQSAIVVALKGEQESEKELREELSEVAEKLLRPLERHMRGREHWIFSPDASLWLVPWAALPLEDGSYVVEKHSIRHVATGRELLQKPGDGAVGGAYIAADPDYDLGTRPSDTRKIFSRLPGTAREAQEIAPKLRALLKSEPTVYTDRKATEAVVKGIKQASTVLLSTHGFFFDLPPEQNLNPLLCCGLAFAGANHRRSKPSANDGILTGMEICNMNLAGTRLVVLSACETGVGQVNQGEGVAGLRQAFQLAGAEAVLASLWSVADDETATLMSGFFEELAAGKSHTMALRDAQLEMIKSRRSTKQAAHPVFWAPFTLTSGLP